MERWIFRFMQGMLSFKPRIIKAVYSKAITLPVVVFITVNEEKKHLTGKGAWLPPTFDFCVWDNNEIIWTLFVLEFKGSLFFFKLFLNFLFLLSLILCSLSLKIVCFTLSNTSLKVSNDEWETYFVLIYKEHGKYRYTHNRLIWLIYINGTSLWS